MMNGTGAHTSGCFWLLLHAQESLPHRRIKHVCVLSWMKHVNDLVAMSKIEMLPNHSLMCLIIFITVEQKMNFNLDLTRESNNPSVELFGDWKFLLCSMLFGQSERMDNWTWAVRSNTVENVEYFHVVVKEIFRVCNLFIVHCSNGVILVILGHEPKWRRRRT